MPAEWTDKQERKYEHIVASERDSGEPTARAKEIAARTIQKERARSGQSKTASRSSLDDMSSAHRGGVRSHRSGPRGRTKAQLYGEARRRNIPGRSSMSKAELERAVDARKRS
jgi:hypothetical protein